MDDIVFAQAARHAIVHKAGIAASNRQPLLMSQCK
jgi:hypothetical protein